MNSSIIIREINSISEMKALEKLQKDVWGWDDLDTMPLMNFIVTREVGGVLIGAFDGETPVGFCFGFVGSHNGHIIFHSHMLAVLPQFREHGIGQKLKLAQREHALAKGFTCITWTFDPLQSPNAYLNFTKLGVIANEYRINFYGEKTSSALHRFIGTDRLWVNWLLESERVRKRIEGGEEPSHEELEKHFSLVKMSADGSPHMPLLIDERGHATIPDWFIPRSSQDRTSQEVGLALAVEGAMSSLDLDYLLIDVPADIGVLQQENPELAVAWRNATRAAFTDALAAGYTVEEFYRIEREGQSAGCYLLSSHGIDKNTN